MPLAGFEVELASGLCGIRFLVGPGGAEGDPFREDGDLVWLELAGGRHLVRRVIDRFNEQAFVGLLGDDRGAAVASLQHELTMVEPQVSLLLLASMAFIAARCEQRTD